MRLQPPKPQFQRTSHKHYLDTAMALLPVQLTPLKEGIEREREGGRREVFAAELQDTM